MRDHVRICGSPGGAIPGATRPATNAGVITEGRIKVGGR